MAKVIIFCHNRVELKVFVWKYIKFNLWIRRYVCEIVLVYREVESAIFYDSIFAACFEFYKERPREYHSYSVIVYIEVLCPSEKQFALHHIECSSRRSFAYFHLYLAPRCCQVYFGIVQFEQIFVRLTFIERERKVHRHRSIKIR